MKPLNYDNSPCNPTSSNCVVWQGPNLDCIKLCTGDTVSDVIANLATELCNVMDELSITNYDLSCFNLVGCKPETYQELLQFLINKVCTCCNIPAPVTEPEEIKQDLITVAPCFVVNGITNMSLIDYVTAIGLRICDILDQIAILASFETVVVGGTNINVTNSFVGNTTTFTVNSIGLDYYNAQVTIGGGRNTVTATINNVANAAGKTIGYGGNSYLVPNQVQDVLNYNYTDSNGTVQQTSGTAFVAVPSPSTFVTLDNTTGVFTILKSGEYLLTMACYLKASSGNNAYWKTSGEDGRFDIGICSGSTNSRNIFTGSSKSIVANMDSTIILNAQCTVQIQSASTPGEAQKIIFRILNLSGTNYAGGSYIGSDSIRVGIVKLRDL
jgi:hypothetical protein